MNIKLLKKVTLVMSIAGLLGATVVFADSATPALNFLGTAGAGPALSSVDSSVTVTGKTVTAGNQVTSGTITNITVTNVRGDLVGWTVSSTVSNLVASTTERNGSGATTANGISYTGQYGCKYYSAQSGGSSYKVVVNSFPSATSVNFDWTGPDGVTVTSTTTNPGSASSTVLGVGVGAAGIAVRFNGATAGGIRVLPVGCMQYSTASTTPGTLTVTSGTSTGITVSSKTLYTGSGATSDSATEIVAADGYGAGIYSYPVVLDWIFRSNSISGSYYSTYTVTVS